MDLSFLKDPAFIWFIIGIILATAELSAPGLVVIFFGVGAWATSFVLIIFSDIGLLTQICFCLFVSITCLILLRKKIIQKNKISADLTDDFTGKLATVKEWNPDEKAGKVMFKGALWKAITTSNEKIEIDQNVIITSHESITLIITPID